MLSLDTLLVGAAAELVLELVAVTVGDGVFAPAAPIALLFNLIGGTLSLAVVGFLLGEPCGVPLGVVSGVASLAASSLGLVLAAAFSFAAASSFSLLACCDDRN